MPGLCAEFYRHNQAGRTASAGYYRYHGRTLLLAWGYVGEPHNDLALVVTGGSLLLVAGLAEVAVFAPAVAPLPVAAVGARAAVALVLATAAGATAAILVSQSRRASQSRRSA